MNRQPIGRRLGQPSPATPANLSHHQTQRLLHTFLNEAGLRNYRIAPNSANGGWTVSAIHFVPGGLWKTFQVTIDVQTLIAAANDAKAHRALLVLLATTLAPGTQHAAGR